MPDVSQILRDDSLMVIFSYSPAGLGHLRVTDALYAGLPKGISPVLLGSQDKGITVLHRLASLHPLVRSLFEWGQSQGGQQYFFTYLYRWSLQRGTKLLYKQIITLLEQRLERPKTLLIVATHFGLAHQIAVIKAKIMKEQKIKVVLVVQVTDDSPQFIWYVEGADLILVPSNYTKNQLENYRRKVRLAKTQIIVNSYPVSPSLSKELTVHQWQERIKQFDSEAKSHINIVLPVSGAAVGMNFFIKLIDLLYQKCPRFMFHIVAKTSLYTLPYLNELMSRPYVKLHLANHDKEVVNLYETVYRQTNFALEITKPSEQAFKCLIATNRIGGSVLLFAEPVGRQEIDNLNFMVRHGFIPNLTEQKLLWHLADKNIGLEQASHKYQWLLNAKNWRGVVLPHHSQQSAHFIWWMYQQELLHTMTKLVRKQPEQPEQQNETNPEGVAQFWQTVTHFLTIDN